MVVKSETCSFTEFKIYPGHGIHYVRKDGTLVILINRKARSLYLGKKKPARVRWTTAWRRLARKGTAEGVKRARKRRVIKKARAVAGVSVDDLKKTNKNKKVVRKLAKKYDAFVASQALIKQIPRLLGPGLQRAGKFPTVVGSKDQLDDKINEVKATIKFQAKKVLNMSVAAAHVEMTPEQIRTNVNLSCNFLASLLKKQWQMIKVIYIKSTMGPAIQIFF
mmetsp:Transcript_6922/g.13713  ORF Transcript_6922/g.13713 Transcript_6922/m.13713 type:complete len:221 (+) Transcript_6922:13-675(+)